MGVILHYQTSCVKETSSLARFQSVRRANKLRVDQTGDGTAHKRRRRLSFQALSAVWV